MDSTNRFQLDTLLDDLDMDNPIQVLRAVREIEQFQESAIPILLDAIAAQPDQMKRVLVGLLATYSQNHYDLRLVTPMIGLLSAKDPIVATRAFHTLEVFIETIWRDLLPALPTCNSLVKLQILQALQQVQDSRLVEHMVNHLPDIKSPSERYMTIELLGKVAPIGDAKVIALIASYRDDPDHHVQSRVNRALMRLTAPLE